MVFESSPPWFVGGETPPCEKDVRKKSKGEYMAIRIQFNPGANIQIMPTSASLVSKVFYGTIIHSLSLKQIEYIRHGLLFVDSLGVIVRMERNVASSQLNSFLGDIARDKVLVLNDDQFIIPGFIDTHIVRPSVHLP